jgi:hypothetical protein
VPTSPGSEDFETSVNSLNQIEYGCDRPLCTNVLSARPDLKNYKALRFR